MKTIQYQVLILDGIQESIQDKPSITVICIYFLEEKVMLKTLWEVLVIQFQVEAPTNFRFQKSLNTSLVIKIHNYSLNLILIFDTTGFE